MDTPLSPGERELFRREKVQVVGGNVGDLIINTNLSIEARTYVGRQGEVHVVDGDVRITVLTRGLGLGSFVLYQEADEQPVFVTNGLAYTPMPVTAPSPITG